jgi:hypothetical protein
MSYLLFLAVTAAGMFFGIALPNLIAYVMGER